MRVFAGVLAALTGVAGFVSGAPPVEAKGDKTAAIIGGAILGTAIGAALSPKKKVVERVYVTPPPPPPPSPSFSPAPGILCYAYQRACYNVSGGYNPGWTYQVYAR